MISISRRRHPTGENNVVAWITISVDEFGIPLESKPHIIEKLRDINDAMKSEIMVICKKYDIDQKMVFQEEVTR